MAIIDLVILLAVGVGGIFILLATDAVEQFYEFSRLHEDWELDDIVLSTATVVAICMTLFSTRRWQEASQLLQQANTDSLTGLINRRKGWEIINLEVQRASRFERPFSVIMFDIDHFKAINDAHGHLTGDQVLKTVSKAIQGKLRGTDALIRWGGEEFMIVSIETEIAGARVLAERIRRAIEKCSVQAVPVITASFGVTQFVKGDDLGTLIGRVDEKLYSAKLGGRNQVI